MEQFVEHNQLTMGGKRTECPNGCRETIDGIKRYTGLLMGLLVDTNQYTYDCTKCKKQFEKPA